MRVLGLDPVADARGAAAPDRRDAAGAAASTRARGPARCCACSPRYTRHPLDPDALLDRLGLTARGRTPYRRLSGGQQQRLSLAMAVVGRPELVFLDEPTAGLDPQARHATWELVRQLRADGVTVVLTTHFMDEAERLADQVVVVDARPGGRRGQPGRADPRRRRGSCASPRRAGARPGRAARPRCRDGCGVRAAPPASYLVDRRRRSTRSCSPPSPPGAPSAACWPTACGRAPHPGGRLPRTHRHRSCAHERRHVRRRRPGRGADRARMLRRADPRWS